MKTDELLVFLEQLSDEINSLKEINTKTVNELKNSLKIQSSKFDKFEKDIADKLEHGVQLGETSQNRIDENISAIHNEGANLTAELKKKRKFYIKQEQTKQIDITPNTRKYLIVFHIVAVAVFSIFGIWASGVSSDLEKAEKLSKRTRKIKLHNYLKGFEKLIKKDKSNWYYLEFTEPKNEEYSSFEDCEIMKDKNGKYNRKVRVYLGINK